MSDQPPAPPPKKPPRAVVTFRLAGAGKAEAVKYATSRGYEHYTEWIRDLVAAETQNPRHHLRPKRTR